MRSTLQFLVVVNCLFAATNPLHAQRFQPVHQTRAYIDSIQRFQNQNADEQKNIIVEFTDEPMFLVRMEPSGLHKAVSPGRYLSRFSQFATDVDAILSLSHSTLTNHVAIRHRYYKAFFGISATVPNWMLPMIHHLPYVKAVHFDREVHALTDPAIELIGANVVWTTFGTQGEGIRVGIIDSGIDYLHPALGGGFGPGFKVVGGYDIVNNDNDPMDDNGHGTHVSGIVAANADTVKGVAPLATLYAYKALDATGRGLDSDIIEAIERTVDPDQNADDTDKLDVVNMSLGSDGGSPTDPTSIAVNNAIRLGVIFCVAAGNSGGRTPVQGRENNYFFDGSQTISSPGTAELAITVGASVLSDTVARFSSKGPNRMSFSVKPEVVAPGVDINSTYLGSTFRVLSGTSMATPMVTGVAALIKSIHPSWSPALIKSAIVNKAKDIGRSAYLQGGGRVRAVNAVSAKTLVTPSTLSYGLDDPALGTWTSPKTVYVHNKHAAMQSYTVVTNGTLPGISLNVSPSFFSIPANDSLMVTVTLLVNNAVVLIEDENILRFTGRVSFNGSIDTAGVPWAFVRTNRLVVTTSEPNAFFLGYSNASFILSTASSVSWTSPTRAEVYAPVRGTYEFFTLFRNPVGTSKIVINEGISINNNSFDLFLDGAEAIHPLVYHGVDQQGSSLAAYRAPQRALITSLPNLGDWTTTFQGGSDTLLLSAVSNSHSFKPVEFQIDLVDTKTFHTVQFEKFTAMHGPRTAINSPANFIQEHFKVKVPPGTSSAVHVTQIWSYTDIGGTGGFGGIGLDVDTVNVVRDEYAFTGYFGKSSTPTEDISAKFFTSYADVGRSLDYESPFIMPFRDSIVATARELVTPAIPRFESGATMTFGGSPAHLFMLWFNNSFGSNTLHFRTLFRGMLREDRNDDLNAGTYSVYDRNGALVLTRSLNEPRQPHQLTADTYKMVVTSNNYWLRNARGTITLSSEFNLGVGLPANPPSVTSFMMLDTNRHTTDTFGKNERATLQFSVNVIDFGSNELPLVDSTKAWYRKHGTTPWISLALTEVAALVANEGIIMQADLGPATLEDSVAIDLRVASRGPNGFTVDQVVSPAFAVGNWDSISTDITPVEGLPTRFTLGQNYPNPFNPTTTINYQLPAFSSVVLKVFDVLGREVATLVNEKKTAGKYSTTWNAPSMSSGVYFYRLEAGSFVETKKLLLLR